MLRKIGVILLLYYAAGTCASQGATALSGGPRPEKIRNVRAAVRPARWHPRPTAR